MARWMALLSLSLGAGAPALGVEPGADFERSRTPRGPAPELQAPKPVPVVSPPNEDAGSDYAPDRPVPPGVRFGQARGSVFLRDGRQFTGTLIAHDGQTITLRIANIDTAFRVADVDRLRILAPTAEQYARLRSAIPDTDADSVVRLIQWAAERGEWELAQRELEAVLKTAPDHAKARALLNDVTRQVELQRTTAEAPERPEEPDAPAPEAPRPPVARVPTLTPEQINLIKVYEVDLAASPLVSIPRDVLTRALDAKAGHPLAPATREARDAVFRSSPVQQLELLFKLRAREFYSQVRVQGSPPAMRRFADDVQRPYLLGGCATSECHGGLEAGRLVFASARPSSDATVYTNFYILEQFRTTDGRALINWQDPEQSLFLQMGLPREFSTAKHPPVPRGPSGSDAWRATFRSATDPRFKNVVGWIRAMYQPRPDYGLTYEPIRPFTAPREPAHTDPGR